MGELWSTSSSGTLINYFKHLYMGGGAENQPHTPGVGGAEQKGERESSNRVSAECGD